MSVMEKIRARKAARAQREAEAQKQQQQTEQPAYVPQNNQNDTDAAMANAAARQTGQMPATGTVTPPVVQQDAYPAGPDEDNTRPSAAVVQKPTVGTPVNTTSTGTIVPPPGPDEEVPTVTPPPPGPDEEVTTPPATNEGQQTGTIVPGSGQPSATVVTPEQQELMGKDLYNQIMTLPEGPEREQAMVTALNEGKITAQDYLDAKREAKDYVDENGNIDPAKLEEMEKKQRRDRNLVGALSMIGALGNLFNASTSRNGRSVPVADLPGALDVSQTKSREERDKKLEAFRKARQKYGQLGTDILNKGWKDYKDRKERERKADEEARRNDAYIKSLEAKNDPEMQKLKLQEQEEKIKNLQARTYRVMHPVQRASGGSGGRGGSSTLYNITDGDGNVRYQVDKSRWNLTNKSNAWSKVPADIQDEILEEIYLQVNGENNTDPELQQEVNSAFGAASSASNSRARKVTLSEKVLEAAIGMAIDRGDCYDMEAYLDTLVGNQTQSNPDLDFRSSANQGNSDLDFRTKK